MDERLLWAVQFGLDNSDLYPHDLEQHLLSGRLRYDGDLWEAIDRYNSEIGELEANYTLARRLAGERFLRFLHQPRGQNGSTNGKAGATGTRPGNSNPGQA